MRSKRLAIGENNGKEEGDSFPEGWYNTLDDSRDTGTITDAGRKVRQSDGGLTLAANVASVTLGFLSNL